MALLGCCLVALHFPCEILSSHTEHVVKSFPPIVVIHKRFLSYSSGTAGGIENEVNDKLPAEKYSLAGTEGRGRERGGSELMQRLLIKNSGVGIQE